MRVRMTHPSCPTVYEIRPFSNGLCYEIFKNPDKEYKHVHSDNGKTYVTHGQPVKRYPSTLKHALSMTVELMQMNPKTQGSLDVDISKETDKISAYYEKWLNDMVVDIERKEDSSE